MSTLFKKLNSSESLQNVNFSSSPAQSGGGAAAKLAILISLVLSVGALGGAVYVYQSLNAESRQRQALEATQVQFQEKANALEASANDYRAQIETLSNDLKKLSEEKKLLEAELNKSKVEISAFKKKVNQLEEKSEAIKQATESIMAAPVKVAATAVSSSTPSLAAVEASGKARVMTVNRKFNFVVANLGAQDKIKLGDGLLVRKNNGNTAKLKVEKLYDTFSAATILEEPSNDPIREGDTIERAS